MDLFMCSCRKTSTGLRAASLPTTDVAGEGILLKAKNTLYDEVSTCVSLHTVMPLQLSRQSMLLAIVHVLTNSYRCWSRKHAGVSKGQGETESQNHRIS